MLAAGHRDEEREQLVVNDFLESRVEALILLTPTLSAAAITRAAGAVPVVVEGRPNFRSRRVDVVGTDDALGVEIAMGHLVELGYQRIAHVAGITAAARCKGYERSMFAHRQGQQIDIVECDETYIGGYEAAVLLLDRPDRPDRPTAIFAVNDIVALSVLAAADNLGIVVPQELSVVGFDDSYPARLRGVGLTTVAQPGSEMANAMVAALVDRIKTVSADRPAVRRFLPPKFIVRTTTGTSPIA